VTRRRAPATALKPVEHLSWGQTSCFVVTAPCQAFEVDLVQKFIKDYTLLFSNNGKNILLCWIPSHVGISGNEKADTAAKAALSLSVTPMKNSSF